MELKVKGKSVTSSKVKNFQNHFCFKLEIINKNYHKKCFLAIIKELYVQSFSLPSYHGAIKIYVLLCSEITSFPPSEGVGKITFGSI